MDKQIPYTHKTEYYLASKRNKVLTHSIIWMKLDKIILKRQSHKITCCTIPLK